MERFPASLFGGDFALLFCGQSCFGGRGKKTERRRGKGGVGFGECVPCFDIDGGDFDDNKVE